MSTYPLLLSRYQRYFTNYSRIRADYKNALSKAYSIKAPRSIGLRFGVDNWEYPIWAWSKKTGFRSLYYLR
jgi:hypothetical protein